jgi:hypothetical protein
MSPDHRRAVAASGWKAQTVAADRLDDLQRIKSTDVDIITANFIRRHLA